MHAQIDAVYIIIEFPILPDPLAHFPALCLNKTTTNRTQGDFYMRQNQYQLQILHEDADIIVCVKPHGLATQSRRPGTPDLEHLLLNHLAKNAAGKSTGRGSAPYLAVIHRLDQPVSGILVFAKTPAAAKRLNQQLTTDGFGKHYLALVDGCPAKDADTLTDYLVKDSKTNSSRVCTPDTPGAKKARLHYQVVSDRPVSDASVTDIQTPQTLLEVTLDTGRHHQIRVQLSHMGCPIVGDTKYNPDRTKKGWQEIELCAYKLAFRHPSSKAPMEFQIPFHGK